MGAATYDCIDPVVHRLFFRQDHEGTRRSCNRLLLRPASCVLCTTKTEKDLTLSATPAALPSNKPQPGDSLVAMETGKYRPRYAINYGVYHERRELLCSNL